MRVLIFGKGGISQGIADVLEERHQVTQLSKDQCDVRSYIRPRLLVHEHDPDWIINCSGVSCPASGIRPLGAYSTEIETNLVGAFHVARAAEDIPQIHLASVAGLYGKPGHAGYCASKAGVISMVQSLAMEGKKIWAISPGRVDTPMRERDYPQDTPGSRLEPKEIGRVVKRIMEGWYDPGRNIVIRKQGLEKIIVQIDDGAPWKETLRVGQPVTI